MLRKLTCLLLSAEGDDAQCFKLGVLFVSGEGVEEVYILVAGYFEVKNFIHKCRGCRERLEFYYCLVRVQKKLKSFVAEWRGGRSLKLCC